jgi:hypothetical protein
MDCGQARRQSWRSTTRLRVGEGNPVQRKRNERLSGSGRGTSKPGDCASRPYRLAACIAVLALGWPTLGLADCVDTRKASAAEIDFHKKAMATLLAALPPAPVGGSLQYKDNVTSLGQQCGPTGDFTVQASRAYEHNYRKSIVSMAINVQRLPAAAGPLSAAYGTASPGRSAGLKVHNVVWTVSGSDSPLRQALVDAIDRARLEALVGKPLPSVAESEALAARAVPPTVGATGGTAAGSTATSAPAPGMQTATQPVLPRTHPCQRPRVKPSAPSLSRMRPMR